MGTILHTTAPNATTGIREATFEELIAGARHALAIRVRKGAVMASPNAARDYLTMRLAPRDHDSGSRQPVPADRLPRDLPRHHRRRERAPAGSGARSARPGRRRGDSEPQPPAASPSRARRTNASRSACARRWRSSTSACSIT
jgi:hypothetical protein